MTLAELKAIAQAADANPRNIAPFYRAMNPAQALALIGVVEDFRALVEHAITMEHFTPGGSTLGWAEQVLEKLRAFEEGKR